MEHTKGKIEYAVEIKKGWRILLIDGHKRDILHGYSKDFAEATTQELVRRWNAFEEGGIVDELKALIWKLQPAHQHDHEYFHDDCTLCGMEKIYCKNLNEKIESALAKS